jgi:nicotinamidase-related amidase
MTGPEGRGTGLEGRGAAWPSPAPPWLAVIDMQRVFGEPGSAWFTPRFGEIVYGIGKLVEAFRPRVTFTRFVAPLAPAGAWRRYYDQWPFALQPPDAEIYQLIDEFAGEPGPTVDATTFSKWGPELAASVGEGGRLVLAGVSTDCCVLSTAVAAADAGVQVQVVADACAGVNDTSHAQALDILRLYGPLVEVVSLADILGPGSQAPPAGSLEPEPSGQARPAGSQEPEPVGQAPPAGSQEPEPGDGPAR